MIACVGFGHKDYGYKKHEREIERACVRLIEEHGVTQFYFGGRGNFDRECSVIVRKLKERYPQITNTLFLSYMPREKEFFTLPPQYDDSEYPLEKRVPPQFAILQTNKAVIDKCAFVLSGVVWHFGGAYKAVEYAHRKKKQIM